MSRTLQLVIKELIKRETKGVAEYGTTVDRQDLGKDAWMLHAYEEALDLVIYIRRAMLAREDYLENKRIRDIAKDVSKRMGAPESTISRINDEVLDTIRKETE